ncbi:unnamed protein product [Rhizopus stolonifer]
METSQNEEDKHMLIEESGIQKHISFWDKRNKGYITPVDTITGFITLGYNVIFSVAFGAFAGIFLSVLSQTGWLPDPFCRSSVSKLVRSTKQTSGVYDKDGVFVPENFERLFDKYSKSGESITIAEFFKMTKEQEELGVNMRAWALSMVELCTAYFFIGHRGSLSKEDVRAAYDGTLFYRLKDNNTVQRKKMDTSLYTPLAGSYLLSSRKRDSNLRDWLEYMKESTTSIKETAMPRLFRRPSSSVIQGVPAPKPDSFFGKKKETVIIDQEEEEQARTYLTGVIQSDFFMEEHPDSLLGEMGVQNKNEIVVQNDSIFENLTKKDDAHIQIVNNEEDELMNQLLREDDKTTWFTENLTGVKDDEGKMIGIVSEKMQDFTDEENTHSTDSQDDHADLESSPVEPTAMTPPPDEAVVEKTNDMTPIVVPTEKETETVNKKKNKKKKNIQSETSADDSGKEWATTEA